MIRRTFRTLALLLAVAAVASVAASATTGHGNPLRSSLKVNLDIYDAHLSQKCDTEVVATLAGCAQADALHRQAGR